MWPAIDWQIQISDLILLGSGLIAGIKVYFDQRSFNRDVLRTIGTKYPRDGILGDILGLQETTNKHQTSILRLKIRQGWVERSHESGDDT